MGNVKLYPQMIKELNKGFNKMIIEAIAFVNLPQLNDLTPGDCCQLSGLLEKSCKRALDQFGELLDTKRKIFEWDLFYKKRLRKELYKRQYFLPSCRCASYIK